VMPLACASAACLAYAWRARHVRVARESIVAVALVAAVALGAPAPHYVAGDTTLADGFPGERLTFIGVYLRTPSSLVRYAITCCRADAAPIVVRLTHPLALRPRTWVRVSGRLQAARRDSLRLVPENVRAIAPPSDPFVYR
jgi:hypothetical protein